MMRNAVSESETTRLTITWSKEADHALRTFLGSQGMKKGDLSRFIEEAVRWRIFHQTVREAREALGVLRLQGDHEAQADRTRPANCNAGNRLFSGYNVATIRFDLRPSF